MRIVEPERLTETVARLCVESNIEIGEDVCAALSAAEQSETSALAKSALSALSRNAEIAARERLPACQDTGMAVVFVEFGKGAVVGGDITAAINEGVRRGYKAGYFRASVVGDPINRANTRDNTPAVIHYDFDAALPDGAIRVTVAPKGFGSENMSGLRMLTPSDGIEGVESFVTAVVQSAGANPCPPIVVGVGVGGTMERAALSAKSALLREIGSRNPDGYWAEVEERLLRRINALGIGAAGYGGDTTALAVHVETYPTHIAGLPVAVNIGCHCTRHKTEIL